MVKERQMRIEQIALGRIMFAPQHIEPRLIVPPEQRRHDQRRVQISTWLPSSTTRLVGRRKNSIALSALRSIQANSFSRQIIIPGRDEGSSVCRARKKLVSIIRNSAPHRFTLASAAGTSASSMKPYF